MTMPANPFSTYTTLIAAVQDTLNRADLAAAVPAFIQLAEGSVNADDRFRIAQSLVRATAPIDGPYVSVPADYISMQNFRILECPPPGRIEMATSTQMDEYRSIFQVADVPKYYAMLGMEFELLPVPGETYTGQMIYYSRVPPLAAQANGTNWLLQAYPNVYFYGALLHSAPYLKDDSRVPVWKDFYETIAEQIKTSNDRGQFSGSTMKMRTPSRYR